MYCTNTIDALTHSEEEAQKQAEQLMDAFRKENPGAEKYMIYNRWLLNTH